MGNRTLTPSELTKESLMILHQKCNFLGNIHRGYDNRYAQSGAKIGSDLKIRLPNEFTVTSGKTLNLQDVKEESVTLSVSNRKHIDFEFDSEELTLDIDKFSERYLEPAMSVLAANIEYDVLSNVYKDVYNFVDGVDAVITLDTVGEAAKTLTDGLAPLSQRSYLANTTSTRNIIKDGKGLFQDSMQIKEQYKEGTLGRNAGFEMFESTLVPSHTTGTAVEGATGYLIDNTNTEFASSAEISAREQTITVDTGSTTFLAGDVITIVGVNRVHPETKADTGQLQKFVVKANSGASATSLTISPAIIVSGPRQNVTAAAANNAAIHKVGGDASADWLQDLAFHKNAFAFATADLVMPKGVDFAAREVLDGISMRIVRNYDIVNDALPCRIDVLYGYKTLRPQLAVRVGGN